MINAIRWLLVAPLAVFSWLVVFVVALALHSTVVTYCPESYLVSGMCTWKWAFLAQDALIVVGASISAVVFVLVATWTAPDHKARVAMLSYAIGLAAAFWMVLQTDAWAAFAGASCFGLMTAWIAFRRLSRRSGLRDGFQRRLFV
ncbi:MAG: hypothetical protein ACR2QT_08145 [Woeseiaceae bacterium]